MSLLDATLLFQIVHFLIAFFFLRLFLFKPAVVCVQQEESERQHLEDEVATLKRNNAYAQAQKEREWGQCKDHVRDCTPVQVEGHRQEHIATFLQRTELGGREQQKLVDSVSAYLVTRCAP